MEEIVEIWVRVHDKSLEKYIPVNVTGTYTNPTYREIIKQIYDVIPTELAAKGKPMLINNGKLINPNKPLPYELFRKSVYVNLDMVFTDPELVRQNSWNRLPSYTSKYKKYKKHKTRPAQKPTIYDDYTNFDSVYVPPHRRNQNLRVDEFDDEWFDDIVSFDTFWDDDASDDEFDPLEA